MTLRTRLLALCAALGGLGPAGAGVIAGTGAQPSRSQLGMTDAVAFKVEEDGPGHALVVPYFTAQNGQVSVLHLVNTDLDNAKAVKLRWRGAGNADTLLDFTLLLSPGDAWTGAVQAGGDGRAQLATADNSCTHPRLPQGAAQPFSTARLDPNASPAQRAANTREGYVEAIVMADIPLDRDRPPGAWGLYDAIRHFNGVSACTPAMLDAALLGDPRDEAAAARLGFATPTGGLMGTWYIIDVPGSTTFSGAATAIQAVNAAGRPARGNFVLFPQTAAAVAAPERYTADPLLVSAGLASRGQDANGNPADPTGQAVLQALSTDLPDLSTPYYLPAGAENARTTAADLSRALAVKSVGNQYATDSAVAARTDWVIAMPTKRYGVAVDYAATLSRAHVFSALPGPAQFFFSGNTKPATGDPGSAQACTDTGLYQAGPDPQRIALFDREANRTGSGAFTVETPLPVRFCGAVGVLTFAQESQHSALGASLTHQRVSRGLFVNGWAQLTPDPTLAPAGLPLIGASFTKLVNPAAQPGVLGHYGITWPHILKR